MALDAALQSDALDTFAAALDRAIGRDRSPRAVVLAVDASQLALFELLALGAGGSAFYDRCGVARLVRLQLQGSDAAQVLQQQLAADNGPPHATAKTLVVVAPPLPTVAKRLADALRPLCSAAERRCAVLWLPAATSDVTREMERQGAADVVAQADLPLGLIPVDRSVAALCHDSVFGELYVRGDSRSLAHVVRSLLAVERHTGRRLEDVTCHGVFAQRVKTMLALAHRQEEQQQQQQRRGGGGGVDASVHAAGAGKGFVLEKAVIIDRMEDPLSMLLTPMTYEGLLDALVGVNHGVIVYEKASDEADEKTAEENRAEGARACSQTEAHEGSRTTSTQKVVLNHLDALFDEIRDVNFNLVPNQLVNVAKELATEVRGSSVGASASAGKDSQAEFQKVKDLLAKAPHLIKKKRSLTHHLQFVQRIRDLSTQLALRGCVETEMAIMSAGPSASSATAKGIDGFLEEAILREPPLNLYDVVKLLCLCSLVRGGLKPSLLHWYRQQLCHTYGHQILPLLVQLEKMDLLSVENRFDFPKKRKQLLLMRGVLDDEETRSPEDINFMFPYTGYAPMSIRLLQESLGMKYKTSAKDLTTPRMSLSREYESLSSSVSRLSGMTSSVDRSSSNGGRRINVLVYYVGGVTVAELTAFRFLNQKQSEFYFFVAATSICNGSRLLRAIY
ncbi:unnamed protein product [Hyaloperonospora brassicae]|uniref:Uncharacterized protein n=1 Tax=Hyaloperonospora brassicae TaxID=162125 RepID=A0AAV0UCD8_HYABA|nr:unnamed protein product [Hyaloperonospora brassicae]